MKGRFDYLDAIYRALEEDSIPLGVFLDFSRAYNCINYDKLLLKLKSYGIRDITLKWMASYLKGRKRFIKVYLDGNTGKSVPKLVERGLPQGSILCPFLYNVYIFDLCDILINTLITHINYADDNALLITEKT